MSLITIESITSGNPVEDVAGETGPAPCRARQLEEGHILFFPQTPFDLSPGDREFLLGQQQTNASYHKNIAYRPNQDRITGVARKSESEKLRAIMRGYSLQVTRFLAGLLPMYASSWRLDYASFRPQQEEGRELPLRSRNDLLHVDAFPTRPTCGDRILRVFTNINPREPRRWVTSETADILIHRFAGTPGLPLPKLIQASFWARARRSLIKQAHALRLPVIDRSPYDEFMLRLHHFLKENGEFQADCPKQMWEFPPNSTWIVFTDMVSHAALSGQFALEQTFIVSREALAVPGKAPITVLEKLVGTPLAKPRRTS